MTGQLSLILSPPEVERVPWPVSRRLPLLRNHLRLVEHEAPTRPVATPNARRVSRVCQPGYHLGRKPGNAGNTYPPEIDFEERTVTILRGKGGKRRTVGLSTQTMEELARWFEKRAELGLTDAHPVFPVISRPTVGKRMYASCVREQLRDCARRAGIRKRLTPHCFRHGMAVDLVRRGVPIPVISKCLGHSNSAITARYIDHVDGEEALDAMRDRVWLVAA